MLKEREVTDVTIEAVGAGTETNRFTNDLPDGRMLSRSVQIVVEQGATAISEQP